MSDKKEEKEGAEGEGAAKGKSKKKLLLILIPVILLLVGGGAAFFLMGGKEPPKEGEEGYVAEEEVAKPKHFQTVKFEPFIVNLSENTSFLKCTMLIEFDPEIFTNAEKALGGDAHGEAHGGGGSGGAAAEGPVAPARMTEREPMIRDVGPINSGPESGW